MDGIAAAGTILSIRTGTSPDVYTEVANVTTLSGLATQRGATKTTHLTSTRQTRRATMPDDQPLSGTLNYLPASTGHKALYTSYEAGTSEHWKLAFSDASVVLFTGFLTKLEPDASDEESNLELAFEITPDGVAPTWPT